MPSYTWLTLIRPWVPFGVVGGALLLLGACAEPNYGDDEPVVVDRRRPAFEFCPGAGHVGLLPA